MLRTLLKPKIHCVAVADCELHYYEDSCAIAEVKICDSAFAESHALRGAQPPMQIGMEYWRLDGSRIPFVLLAKQPLGK